MASWCRAENVQAARTGERGLWSVSADPGPETAGTAPQEPPQPAQINPTTQSAYTTAIAVTPFTSVTPPYDRSADFRGIRDSDVQTQK